MLPFNKFIKETCFNKYDYPFALISHGSHAYNLNEDINHLWNSPKKSFSLNSILNKVRSFKKSSNWFNENDNSHLGKNVSQIHKHLDTNKKSLNDDEKDSISRYSLSSSKINQHFLDLHKNKLPHTKFVHAREQSGFSVSKAFDSDHMDSALNSHIGHELHTYSGVGFDPEHKANKDGILHLPAYTSTSIDKKIAGKFAYHGATMHLLFAKNIIHFHLKPEDKGLYLGSHSNLKEEHEFALPRNTTIKIHNLNNPDIHKDKDGYKYHIYHASILHQE